jgi:hypothetical protein
MSKLHKRIIGQAGAGRAAAAEYHPHGTPDTPMTMPMTRVYFGGAGADVEQLVPLVTANGAAVPASAPGRYGQVTLPTTRRMSSPSIWQH